MDTESAEFIKLVKPIRGLDDAKKAADEAQTIVMSIFKQAAKEGYQQQLAEYALRIRNSDALEGGE